MLGHASDVELVISGAWLDSDLALRLGEAVTVVVANTVVVKRLTDSEVLPPLVTVTNVPRSEFVLLRVARDMNVDEVENAVKAVGPRNGMLVLLTVSAVKRGYEPVTIVPLKVPFGALSPANPEPVNPVPFAGTMRSWP
jgi:hypothetical protein